MPLSLREVSADTADAELTWHDGTVMKLHFWPSKYTPQSEAIFKAAEGVDGDLKAGSTAEFVATLVKDWELTEEDGETIVPLTLERVRDLPFEFLTMVAVAIGKAMGKRTSNFSVS